MPRLPGLDLLRAWAIVWVMLFHAYVVGGLGDGLAWLGDEGWMGVDLFFVLSGYLIGGPLLASLRRGEPLAWRAFYRRRAFRILPAFLVVLGVYNAWPAVREAPGLAPAWQFLNFTLNLLIDYAHDKAFSHAWSLCVEEHFYLLFPWLAWWLVRRPSMRKTLAVAMGLLALGMAARGWVWLHDMAPVRNEDGPAFGLRFVEGIFYPTWARLDGLLAGVALAAVRVARPAVWTRLQRHAGLMLAVGMALFALALWLFRDRLGFWPSVLGYPLSSLALAACVGAATALPARLAVPGAGWLARVSYSLYLSHKLALHAVATWWVGPWPAARRARLCGVCARCAGRGRGAVLRGGAALPALARAHRRATRANADHVARGRAGYSLAVEHGALSGGATREGC